MQLNTIIPGVLCVGSALPDPPFEFLTDGIASGFDIELMKAIAAELKMGVRIIPYDGEDFNEIFTGLAAGRWDCVASGATITPERERIASFCNPYTHSGQSLVCNTRLTPHVRSIADLHGMILGVQHGNTSEPVAHHLKDAGRVAAVRTYAYHQINQMLDDLAAGKIGAVMKLAPVMRSLIKDRPGLELVQEGITKEALGIAVRLDDLDLRGAINNAQEQLMRRGVLPTLIKKWLDT